MKESIKEIFDREFEAQGNPTLRKFANWMIEDMSKEGNGKQTLSHASLLNWLSGLPPKTDFLEDMLAVYPETDRRFILALRLLAAKSPHVWGIDGVVWRIRASYLQMK